MAKDELASGGHIFESYEGIDLADVFIVKGGFGIFEYEPAGGYRVSIQWGRMSKGERDAEVAALMG